MAKRFTNGLLVLGRILHFLFSDLPTHPANNSFYKS